jgi:hypothetical protein
MTSPLRKKICDYGLLRQGSKVLKKWTLILGNKDCTNKKNELTYRLFNFQHVRPGLALRYFTPRVHKASHLVGFFDSNSEITFPI